MFREQLARGLRGRERQSAGDVLFEREHQLRLRTVALEHDRERFLDPPERLIENFLANSARQRLGPHAVQPVGERRPRRFLRRRDRGTPEGNANSSADLQVR